MTGFARVEGRVDGFSWVWEIRGVNGKSLDQRFRLPPGWDVLDAPCKTLLGNQVKRGSITVALEVSERSAGPKFRINQEVLAEITRLLRSLEGVIDAAPPRLDGILTMRGVLETEEEAPDPALRAIRETALIESFGEAVAAFAIVRNREGAHLEARLAERLAEIAAFVVDAERSAARQPDQIRQRFQQQMDQLFAKIPPLSEERLAQEVALTIGRADIREELDRLAAHVAAARELLAEAVNIGRRLDFLCQEFNREANTICSKSADIALTRTGLALKAAIEQLREQVQNIE
jgi:uncharacterized protein (TIGR00255 family)